MNDNTPKLKPVPVAARSFQMHNQVTGDVRVASESEAIQLGGRGYHRLAEIVHAGGSTRDASSAQLNPSSGTITPMD